MAGGLAHFTAAHLTKIAQTEGSRNMSQVGVRFHEIMKGWVAVPQTNFGDSGRAWLEVRAQVFIEDLDAFLADNRHGGQLVCTIDFDGVGHGIPATGHVELFTMSADGATRLMRYQAFFGAN